MLPNRMLSLEKTTSHYKTGSQCVCVCMCERTNKGSNQPAQVATLSLYQGRHDSYEEAELNILHHQHPEQNAAVVVVTWQRCTRNKSHTCNILTNARRTLQPKLPAKMHASMTRPHRRCCLFCQDKTCFSQQKTLVMTKQTGNLRHNEHYRTTLSSFEKQAVQ